MSIIDKFTTPKEEGIALFIKCCINSLKFRMWKDDGYKVMRSCTAAPISTGVALSQVRDLFCLIRDLFCLIKDLCETVGDLWRVHLAVSGRAGKVNHSHWKSPNLYREDALYARVYTYFISRKMYSLIHMMLVSFWMSTVSGVKVLNSKCSHGQQSLHTDGERLWRAESVSLHTGNPLEISRKTVKTPQWRWILWNQSLHTRISWKSGIKSLHVKEWMLFSGNKKRIEACEPLGK